MIDRFLYSEEKELLELEGATPKGIEIIDELNEAYRISGLFKKITRLVTSDIRKIHTITNRPVKILEIGMRDGMLLNKINEFGVTNNIPLILYGVEFKDNLAQLAIKRLNTSDIHLHAYCIYNNDFGVFADNYFDVVYSAFVLHHQTLNELEKLIFESLRMSEFSVYHLDLSRSLVAIILIWCFYTFRGFFKSRKDAVLSCRKSYTKTEINQILQGHNSWEELTTIKIPPIYLSIQKGT